MFKNKIHNKEYLNGIKAPGIFDNSYDDIMPQTIVQSAILNHFQSSEKVPKCLFLGWDGCRADAMKYLISNGDARICGSSKIAPYSAVSMLKEQGGLYVTYVGGDNGVVQETSTAQGWASALCGKWMKKEWRQGIEWSLDYDYPTILKTLAMMGYETSFNAIWPIHFSNTYRKEIDYAQESNLKQLYCKFETDEELFKNCKERIASDDDLIFTIFEGPDMNGHGTGFGDDNYRYVSNICNLDTMSYYLIKELEKRKTFEDEDWLVVICSDHGGHAKGHGTQKITDRTTFLALSKPVEELIK
mgnify:FL=1